MPVIAPEQYATTSAYELLEAASGGYIAVDQRLLHALLDDPARTLPDIVRFSRENRTGGAYLGADLLRIFCLHPSMDAMPLIEREIREFPDEIPEELTELLIRLGPPVVEPLLALHAELGDKGRDLLFELACLGVADPRIEERIQASDEERDFLLPIYREHSARASELEPFEIWARYPEEDEPDLSHLPERERLPFLDSEYPPHRIGALEALLHEEHRPAVRTKILGLAKSDPEIVVRCVAWEALREDFDAPEVRRALLARLKDQDAPLEERVSAAIGASYMHYEEPEVGKVLRAGYEDDDLRASAIEGMWRTLDQQFAEYVEPHLGEDEQEDVRSQAITAVGMLRMEDSIPEIEEAFDDPHVRDEALHAWILAAPGPTTKDAMAKLRERLEELVGGFGEGEAHVVDAAIELRCELAGLEEEPPPPPAVSSKVGRNDPCPCGSGKKFKKCCGAN